MAEDVDHVEVLPDAGDLPHVTSPAVREQHLLDRVDDVDSLAVRAAAVAADQAALQTRQTYASVYRAFCTFVGPDAPADAFTGERVRAYRDELEPAPAARRPRSPSSSPRCARSPRRSAPMACATSGAPRSPAANRAR